MQAPDAYVRKVMVNTALAGRRRLAGTTVDVPDEGFDIPTSRLWILRCAADSGPWEVALGPGNGGDPRGSMFR